ncbi:MAG: transglutaminase-like domain-containing protein [Bacteroidota bacterium]|jgi:regulator of sirC expression with transglutaminase-like and TPR domain
MKDLKKNSELKALVSLLDEPDERIYLDIRNKLLDFGPDVLPVLESTWENTFNEEVQERIESIMHVIQFDKIYEDLSDWVKKDEHNLLEAYIIVSRFQYPDLDEMHIIEQINKLKRDIWLELNENLTAFEEIKVFNRVLFEINKFTVNIKDIHHPQNSFINTFLETKKGNALSLGILYIILAQSQELPIYGVNLPQNFVLAYTKDLGQFDEEDVLFYINPVNKGIIFSRNEIDNFLNQLKTEPEKTYYTPCSNLSIIRRLINNLVYSYNHLEKPDKVEDLKKLLSLFEDL